MSFLTEQESTNNSYKSTQTKQDNGFYKIQPWKHQLEAIEKAAEMNEYALFFEVGTGKTLTAINILRHWYKRMGQVFPTLIFCPPVIISQWAKEWEANSNIGHLVVELKGTGKQRLQKLKDGLAQNKKIFITNYETLQMEPMFMAFMQNNFWGIVCDEAHKLKNHQAKRTKSVIKLADQSHFRLILTGTPILNSHLDIFSQFRVLDKGQTFGRSFWEFQGKYFYDKNAGMPANVHFPDIRPKPGTEEFLNTAIYSKAMKAVKSECLDLPPFVRTMLPVGLSPRQRRMYEELKDEFITFVDKNESELGESKAVVANMALVKILRMQEIVSGFYTAHEYDLLQADADTKVVEEFDDVPRLDALQELLENIDPKHKVIIWAPFRRNYEMIRRVCEKIGRQSVELNGSVSAKQRDENITRFKTDDDCGILVANPKAGGVGLNLIEAPVCIYYARGYSLEDDIQSEARNYRGGSERHEKVTRIDLYSPNTIDEEIINALRQKKRIADNILAIRDKLALC